LKRSQAGVLISYNRASGYFFAFLQGVEYDTCKDARDRILAHRHSATILRSRGRTFYFSGNAILSL